MPRRLFPLTVIVLVLWPAGAPLSGSSHSKEPAGPARRNASSFSR